MSRKTYFNEVAKTWDERFCTLQLAFFLRKFVPQFGLEPGQNILDVGTGTGVLIPYLIQAVGPSGSVTAIDYAEKMVQICRSKHEHLKNVIVKLQDVEEDNLPSESFDAVTCFGLFPHLDKKDKALRNMNRALKPGGILVIAHALSSEEIKAHHANAASSVMNDTLPAEVEMKQLLERTGFAEIHIKDEQGCYFCISTRQ
jgi:ubiquinone/menaquinone biosynthesis C-methylase UbiE